MDDATQSVPPPDGGLTGAPRHAVRDDLPTSLLLGDILRASARVAGTRVALIDGERRMSYAEFDATCDRLAAALVTAGFGKGDRIAAMMMNRSEYALLFFAAARAGVVLCHLSTRTTPRDIAHSLGKVGARALFIQQEMLAQFEEARSMGASCERVIVIGGARAEVQDFIERATTVPMPHLTADDLLGVNFTGGTTGSPKAVAVTHGARAANVIGGMADFRIDARDVCIVATPMFHTVGLYVWFGTVIAVGATALLQPNWQPRRFLDVAEHHGASATLLVPTQLIDLLGTPEFLPTRLAAMRTMHHAGAPMAGAVLDRLEATLPWVKFIDHYGQSETGQITLRAPEFNRSKRESVGRPVAGIEARIVDRDGTPQPPGLVGELVTRGPHLLQRYWNDPEQTAAAFRYGDGWLATGDLGRCDDDGFITLVDRAKDMIVSGAENIYPMELENALYRHPDVRECAVFGIPDARWGEVPAAHVVLRAGATVDKLALIAHVERETIRWKRPRVIEFVESLPKTAIGKIQKNLLREPYWRHLKRRI